MLRSTTTLAALAALATAAPAAAVPTYSPRAVALTDARTAPTDLAYLQPGTRASTHPCGGSVSDVSAYGPRGRALGPQTRRGWRTRTGRVTYRRNGARVTFRNASRRPVIVAVWCG